MSEILDEQLSAFLDGELPEAELELLLARLDRDPARRAIVARYSMIGECMRTGSGNPAALGLIDEVRSAVLAETAPAANPPRRGRTWRGWAAGGVAAAAALVAVLVAGPAERRDQATQATQATQAKASEPGVIRMIEEPFPSVRSPASRRLNPGAAARLTGYLVAHGEYTNQLSRSNFDSRLVSARAERASWQQPGDLANVR